VSRTSTFIVTKFVGKLFLQISKIELGETHEFNERKHSISYKSDWMDVLLV